MTNVLFVCTVPTDKSGIPNVIFNLLDRIDTTRYNIGYVAINEPTEYYKEKLRKINSKLFVISRKIYNPFGYIKNLTNVAKDYDIIHVHGNSATMVLEMIAAKLAGVKVRIAHSHNTTCNMKTIDAVARPLFYTLCNGRLACGNEAGYWLFRNKKFTIINNGIDVEKFRFNKDSRDSIRANIGVTDECVIGHIGNFVEQKNHSFLIDIFKKYSEIQPTSKLLLLGDGPLRCSIQSKVQNLGLEDKVIFAGSVDHPEEYVNAMDLVVMPSLFEGLPLTLVEEQANGLSIVAADTITPDANMTGNIRFVPLSHAEYIWANHIQKLLTESSHNEESSNAAITIIKKANYDVDSAARTLELYYYDKLKS